MRLGWQQQLCGTKRHFAAAAPMVAFLNLTLTVSEN